MMQSLPKTSETKQAHMANIDAPSPTSSTVSDLELPDAFVQPRRTGESSRKQQEVMQGMDLDSRITSFLAAGPQGLGVSNNILSTRNLKKKKCIMTIF
jgi:hypothetical protein